MLFKPGTPLLAYEVQREAGQDVMYVNFLGASFVPSLVDSSEVMALIMDYLSKSPNVTRIVFVQQRNYNYDFSQVVLLQELSKLYTHLVQQEKILSPSKLAFNNNSAMTQRHGFLNYLVGLMRGDPVACYVELEREIAKQKHMLQEINNDNAKYDLGVYLRTLDIFYSLLKETKLIKAVLNHLDDYHLGGRDIYDYVFRPDIIPNFTFTRLVSQLPKDSEIVDQYEVGEGYDKSIVTILKKDNEVTYFYHVMPPEYSLDEGHHMLMNLARNVLVEHQPQAEEFTDPERTRQVFFNVSKDLIRELSVSQGIKVSYSDLNKLATILVRHTIGFGLIEILLKDNNLQDIVLNAPVTQNPVYVKHGKFGECGSNIVPSQEDADSWAAKFRLISGRPLDEANPILDTDLNIGDMRARIAVIQQPLSPSGLSYAIRRHRESPWTLPLFIKNKMINSFAAGLMSFMIDGNRTMLVAGTRSSGKTSLLGALMLEIMPKYRIITIEDTPELAVEAMRKLKYDILSMKVRSALLKTTNEVGADEGIRTSLRLGDSSLIVGEIRSLEAKALYEAMRVGALANVVAGTIHGASPYGVFDRVVNDLEVPVTSFKATDCIIVANPVRSPDGMHSTRRMIQLSEVRKHWTKDPMEEKGFVDLLKYNVNTDELEITEDLVNGDSEIIKNIAGDVKGWAGNWDAVYDNILLRAKTKAEIVKVAEKFGKPEILEAGFNVLSNNIFHQISDEVNAEVGLPVGDRVFPEWQKWLMKEIKKV